MQELELYSCELENDFDSRKKKFDHIQLTDLTTLNLSHNEFTVNDEALGHVFSEAFGLVSASVETLCLVNIGITKVPQQKELIYCLKRLPNLYELDISENKGIKLDAVLTTAKMHCTNLETLIFADSSNNSKGSSNPVLITVDNGLDPLRETMQFDLLKRLDLDGTGNISFIL